MERVRWQDKFVDTDRIDNNRWNGRIKRKKCGKLWRCGHTTTDNSSYRLCSCISRGIKYQPKY